MSERYSLLRNEINRKYDMLDIVRKYNPTATYNDTKMISILNDYRDTPSMVINYQDRWWKCYTTGHSGGYLELLYYTRQYREQITETISSLADKILRSDRVMQYELGFKTLYSRELPNKIDLSLRSGKTNTTKPTSKSFNRIVKELFEHNDKELLVQFISEFELGTQKQELCDKFTKYLNDGVSVSKTQEFESLLAQVLCE